MSRYDRQSADLFSLNFDVLASIDATMLGFEMVAHEGASSYGLHAVHHPRVGVHGEEPKAAVQESMPKKNSEC